MSRSVSRNKPLFNKDEQVFTKHLPLPPKTRRLKPKTINRNHLLDVTESLTRLSGVERTYDYILHATKGWRRRRVIPIS